MKGTGEIVKWKTEYVINTDTNKKLTFTIDPAIKIAGGYLPEPGDIVKFTYEAGKMALKELELVGKKRDYKAGWITEWEKEKNKVKIKMVSGDTLELGIAEKIDVLVGYEPKVGDFVYLKYDDQKKEITYVRFLSHPEKAVK